MFNSLVRTNVGRDESYAFQFDRAFPSTEYGIQFLDYLNFTGDYSIEMRFNLDTDIFDGSGQAMIFHIGKGTPIVRFYRSNGGNFFLAYYGTSGIQSGAHLDSLGVWHHVVITVERGVAAKAYFNGTGEINLNSGITPEFTQISPELSGIGYGFGGTRVLPKGKFRGLRLFDKALTPDEVTELYSGVRDKIKAIPASAQSNCYLQWNLDQLRGGMIWDSIAEDYTGMVANSDGEIIEGQDHWVPV